ncbi:glucosaminidase domain-containing protein [Mucilaginibacter sp. UC70_90]
MRKIIYLFIAVVCLNSCSARKKTTTVSNRDAKRNNSNIQKANKDAIANYRSYNSLEYIDRFKAIAIQEMNQYGIPASITLAQGLFESGRGQQ